MKKKKQSNIEAILKILDEDELEFRRILNFLNNSKALQDISADLSKIWLEPER